MTDDLPVPVRVALPSQEWSPATAEELGIRNAAFVAVRKGFEDYTPLLTVSGDWRDDPATLPDIADESLLLARRQGATDVRLEARREVGGPAAPAVLQTLAATIEVDGRTLDLRQVQVLLALMDLDVPDHRAVIIHTLTCTAEQLEVLGDEFQAYLASVEVAPTG